MARFGADAAAFVGRHVSSLIAPIDQAAFAVALAALGLSGRIPPQLVRMADFGQTAASVAALLMPGPPARMYLTVAAAPAGSSNQAGTPPALAEGTAPLVHAALQHFTGSDHAKSGPPPTLALIELPGWADLRRGLSPDDQAALQERVGQVLTTSGAGALASAIGDGRYGVLAGGTGGLDMPGLVARLEKLLRDLGPGGGAGGHVVSQSAMPLASEGLDGVRAARALRFALTCFAERGPEAARRTPAGPGPRPREPAVTAA